MHSSRRADAHRRTLRRHHLQRAPGHDRSGEWKFSRYSGPTLRCILGQSRQRTGRDDQLLSTVVHQGSSGKAKIRVTGCEPATAAPGRHEAVDTGRHPTESAHSTIEFFLAAFSMVRRKRCSRMIRQKQHLASCCARSAGSQTSTRAVQFPCSRSPHRRSPAPLV